MTFAKLIIGTFAFVVLGTLVKIIFIRGLNIDSQVMVYVMWIFFAIVTIASVRRLGVLNYLESFFVAVVWLCITAVVDLLVIGTMTQYEVYRHAYFSLTYVILIVVVIMFHKKAHVHIRRAIRAKVNAQEK